MFTCGILVCGGYHGFRGRCHAEKRVLAYSHGICYTLWHMSEENIDEKQTGAYPAEGSREMIEAGVFYGRKKNAGVIFVICPDEVEYERKNEQKRDKFFNETHIDVGIIVYGL